MAGISLANLDVGGIFSGVGQLAKDIRVAVTGIDPVKQMEIQIKLLEFENAAMSGQMEINKIEAASPNLFVSGARPAAIWICNIALLYNYVLMPFIVYFVLVFKPGAPAMPSLDMSELLTLLFGLLGVSAMRSFDKIKLTGK